jgi:ABC-type phosphate transport system substrate-binding protein
VAVIVHPSNPVGQLSRRELSRIFRLRQQRWPDGKRIYLIMLEEGSREKRLVLERVYRMSGDQLKRFWLSKIYRGELTSFPQTVGSSESVRRFVGRVPNAIGYVDAKHTDGVKVLRIDGKPPGDPGYTLRAKGDVR